MIIDPISAAFGVAQIGMGIFGSMAGNSAARQDYLNQRAFQEANSKFTQWQARLNQKLTNANAQYDYWAQTVNYNQGLAFAKSQRNVELMKSIRQAEVVRDTRAAAGAAYIQDSAAISEAYQEASMQEAVAHQQYQWRALQARASVQAMNMEGKSIDRLVNDYARQESDYMALANINQQIRSRQYTREQAGQVAQYLSRWNSQTFYDEQKVFDPLPPFAPLPALLQPAGPTMTGAGPSAAAGALNIGTSVLGGLNSFMSMNSQMVGMRTPSSPTGPGTGG